MKTKKEDKWLYIKKDYVNKIQYVSLQLQKTFLDYLGKSYIGWELHDVKELKKMYWV